MENLTALNNLYKGLEADMKKYNEVKDSDSVNYIVFFKDGSKKEFKAACEIGAKEYSEYTARLRNTEIDFIL